MPDPTNIIATRRPGVKKHLKISLPQNLADRFDILCFDRAKGRPMYGFRSIIITELIAEWVASHWNPEHTAKLSNPHSPPEPEDAATTA